MKQFKFKGRITRSRGRNGDILTTGLSIFKAYQRLDDKNETYETIRIYPITSYGKEGNSFLEIPIPEIEELIEQLKTYIDGN